MPRKKGPGRPKKSSGAPARKQARVVKKQPVKVSKLRQAIRSVRWSDSYTSLLMGVVVVVVAVLFIVSFLRTTHHIQETSSISTVAPTASSTENTTPTPVPSEFKPGQKTYTVKPGDDLWHISEKIYKSGYNWVDIAEANHLTDPGSIFAGNVLTIPNVAPKEATVSVTPAPQPAASNAITANTYTVQKGDDLWHIAVRAYGDGYQWVKIAQVNNLANPSLIFSGNVLKIPR